LARDILAIESSGEYKAWSFYRALERVANEGRGAVILLYYPETATDIDAEVEAILNPGENRVGPASDVVYQQVGTGSQILMDLGVQKMRLMSAPFKFTAISGFDLEVVEYVNCD
jgi:3,4-dihydroxy 2-butanone 4-phosphate synthase/GTP cyclohydrolase II